MGCTSSKTPSEPPDENCSCYLSNIVNHLYIYENRKPFVVPIDLYSLTETTDKKICERLKKITIMTLLSRALTYIEVAFEHENVWKFFPNVKSLGISIQCDDCVQFSRESFDKIQKNIIDHIPETITDIYLKFEGTHFLGRRDYHDGRVITGKYFRLPETVTSLEIRIDSFELKHLQQQVFDCIEITIKRLIVVCVNYETPEHPDAQTLCFGDVDYTNLPPSIENLDIYCTFAPEAEYLEKLRTRRPTHDLVITFNEKVI